MEQKKLGEFSKVEDTKARYEKFVDAKTDEYFYTVVLPNGEQLEKVDFSLALYVHSLERRLGLK